MSGKIWQQLWCLDYPYAEKTLNPGIIKHDSTLPNTTLKRLFKIWNYSNLQKQQEFWWFPCLPGWLTGNEPMSSTPFDWKRWFRPNALDLDLRCVLFVDFDVLFSCGWLCVRHRWMWTCVSCFCQTSKNISIIIYIYIYLFLFLIYLFTFR